MLHGRHGVNVTLKTFPSQKLHNFEKLAYTSQHPVSCGSSNPTSGASASPISGLLNKESRKYGLGVISNVIC